MPRRRANTEKDFTAVRNIDDGNWQARDQAGRHHRIPTNQSAGFSDGPLRLAQFD
jgi:hypothetical protein